MALQQSVKPESTNIKKECGCDVLGVLLERISRKQVLLRVSRVRVVWPLPVTIQLRAPCVQLGKPWILLPSIVQTVQWVTVDPLILVYRVLSARQVLMLHPQGLQCVLLVKLVDTRLQMEPQRARLAIQAHLLATLRR